MRRFAGATPFRRCGIAVPTLCQSHGRGGPIAAVHGCQAQPGCRRRHMHAHRKSRRRLSPSCPFLQVCSQRPRLERRPTAPQATFSCLSLPVPLPPTVRHPPVPIQHRALPPSPPLPPQPGQPTSGSGRPISSRCHAVEQLDLDTVEPVARRRHWRDVRRTMRRVLATPRRHGGAWSMEQGAWSHAGRRLGPGARWRERLPWTILPKR